MAKTEKPKAAKPKAKKKKAPGGEAARSAPSRPGGPSGPAEAAATAPAFDSLSKLIEHPLVADLLVDRRHRRGRGDRRSQRQEAHRRGQEGIATSLEGRRQGRRRGDRQAADDRSRRDPEGRRSRSVRLGADQSEAGAADTALAPRSASRRHRPPRRLRSRSPASRPGRASRRPGRRPRPRSRTLAHRAGRRNTRSKGCDCASFAVDKEALPPAPRPSAPSRFARIAASAVGSFSTKVACAAPRDKASSPSAPLPA